MDHSPFLRPRTIDELRAGMRNLMTEQSVQRGLGIAVRPSDVFITPYAKSGTTWLQHVAHGLRSGGSMEFDEICDVVPWLEIASDLGVDPGADQKWPPRLFKAHLTWEDVPKGGRYIVAFRDPKTVLVSMYQFFEGWFFEPGTITIEDLGRGFFLATRRYFNHVLSWAPLIGAPHVLVLSYEDMVEAPERLPGVVADFLQIGVPAQVMAKVVHQSSREFMAANEAKFDNREMRKLRDPVMGLPPGGPPKAKVQRASAVKPKVLPQLASEIDGVWREMITPVLGHATYGDFRLSLPNPLRAGRSQSSLDAPPGEADKRQPDRDVEE